MSRMMYSFGIILLTLLDYSNGQGGFGFYNLDPATEYKCIRVQGDSSSDNAELFLSRCDTSKAYDILIYNGYLITPSYKCITVNGGSATPGAHGNQYECVGAKNQVWTLVSGSSGFQVQSSVSSSASLCLTAQSNGAYLDIQNCDSTFATLSQIWTFALVPNAYGPLTNVGTGDCIHTIGDANTAGGEYGYDTCSGGPYRQVQIATGSDYWVPGYYSLGGMCMVVNSKSLSNGVHVVQGTCTGQSDQTWIINGAFPGPFQVLLSAANKCLTADSGKTYTYITDCTDGNNYQKWTFQFSPQNVQYEVQNGGVAKCLHVVGDSTADNANLELVSCSGSGLYITVDYNAVHNIAASQISFQTGKCLTVNAASNSAGTVINQYSCAGVEHQKWNFIGGNIFYDVQIKSASSGLCMTAEPQSDGSYIIDQQPCVANVIDNKFQFWRSGIFV